MSAVFRSCAFVFGDRLCKEQTTRQRTSTLYIQRVVPNRLNLRTWFVAPRDETDRTSLTLVPEVLQPSIRITLKIHGALCSVVDKALGYKPEGRGFETRCGELIFSIR
jgi:hypothetical protein